MAWQSPARFCRPICQLPIADLGRLHRETYPMFMMEVIEAPLAARFCSLESGSIWCVC